MVHSEKGNRIPGLIDKADVPIIEIAQSNFGNPLFDVAMSFLKNYNRQMAILLDSTKDLEVDICESQRKLGIEKIQRSLLVSMNSYNDNERSEIVKAWAYEIYKSERAVHDSILWIGSTDNLRGTGDDTIDMLANVGVAMSVKKNGCVKRVNELKVCSPAVLAVRVWSREELTCEMFANVKSIAIAGKAVNAGGIKVNLGNENNISNGVYAISRITPSYSRKNGCYALKNSLTLVLQF